MQKVRIINKKYKTQNFINILEKEAAANQTQVYKKSLSSHDFFKNKDPTSLNQEGSKLSFLKRSASGFDPDNQDIKFLDEEKVKELRKTKHRMFFTIRRSKSKKFFKNFRGTLNY